MRAARLLVGLFIAGLAGLLAVARPEPLLALDWLVYDALVRSEPAPADPSRSAAAVVAIDEASLARYGQWPWSRNLVAELVDRLHAMGATTIAFDVLFAEPDREDPGADARLAAVLARSPSVLGHGLLFDAVAAPPGCHLRPVELVERQRGDQPPHARLFEVRGAICPLPVLARAAGATGFINATPDADGRLRRVPLLVRKGDDVYASLALAAVRRVTGGGPLVLDARADGSMALTVGSDTVALDAWGRMLVRHRPADGRAGPIGVADILDGRVDPSLIRGRIVFVGATALGLRDVVTTPSEQGLPGVVLHAAVADTLMGAPGFERTELAPLIEVFAAVAGAMLVAVITWRLGMVAGVVSGLLLAAGAWWGARGLLVQGGQFFSPFWAWIGIAAALVIDGALGLVRERRRADRERRRRSDAQRLIVQALTTLTETRDADTGRHARRTQELTLILATALALRPAYRSALDAGRVSLISTLAPLHDIGKVGVSDAVLRKPGALTPAEADEMRRHPELGYESLLRAETLAGVHDDEVLAVAKDIVHTHHERWDGLGYPRGLREEQIPVSGRLVALVDAYDALVGGRSYRAGVAHEEAVQAIVDSSGKHFDPEVVEAFLSVHQQFRALLAH